MKNLKVIRCIYSMNEAIKLLGFTPEQVHSVDINDGDLVVTLITEEEV